MASRTADARWEGDLPNGKGTMRFGNGAFEGEYSAKSRFEEGEGTNPEELIAAAHAGCFSMAFSNELAKAGHTPVSVDTNAAVNLRMGDDGPRITRIKLTTTARVPGISEEEFQSIAQAAKEGCPVSQALAAVDEIVVDAMLES
jgi:osmotically inducible protein OsmC